MQPTTGLPGCRSPHALPAGNPPTSSDASNLPSLAPTLLLPAAGAPVPADAPFEVTYLHARLPIAAEDELQQVRGEGEGAGGWLLRTAELWCLAAGQREACWACTALHYMGCCTSLPCWPSSPRARANLAEPCSPSPSRTCLPPAARSPAFLARCCCSLPAPRADAVCAGAQGAGGGGRDQHPRVPGGKQ